MNIGFTAHAVERFIERVMPKATQKEAIARMRAMAERGLLLKERLPSGDEQLLSDGVIFALKRDGDSSASAVCATVLFDCRSDSNPLAQEIEIYGIEPNCPVVPPVHKKRRSRRSSRW